MSLFDELLKDDSPAARAALQDYLIENDVPQEEVVLPRLEANIFTLLQRACKLAPGSEDRVALTPNAEARLRQTKGHSSVTLYVFGRKLFRVGQKQSTWTPADLVKKSVWLARAVECPTTRRILCAMKT